MNKTNTGLAKYVKAQLGLPYWYGTYGQIATEALHRGKKKQYPLYYTASDFPTQYGKRVHDCSGLIKGYLMSDSPTAVPVYNKEFDYSANGLRNACKEKGDIFTMPDMVGVLVFYSGHVGVYIGNGEVIEARGHAYGVVKTRLKDRPWKWWGKHPNISYEEPQRVAVELSVLKKGSKGDEVKTAQRLLLAEGYELGKWGADGDFGAKTYAVVKEYQSARGLKADGVIGKDTWNKLLGVKL